MIGIISGAFRSCRGGVDQIFTLNQTNEKRKQIVFRIDGLAEGVGHN